ncbi:signal peptidase I [Leptospira sp. 96542]|nr:signal peptidase I [Leptospira sp. 96542]
MRKKILSIMLNLLALPYGFVVYNDFKMFLLFSFAFLLLIPYYLILYFVSFLEIPFLLIFIQFFSFVILFSLVIYYTIQSARTYPLRPTLTSFGKVANFFILTSISLVLYFAEDYLRSHLRLYTIDVRSIVSGSSEPSLRKLEYFYLRRTEFDIKHGDFVGFRTELGDNEGREFIKRVVAIPGDTIEVKTKTHPEGFNYLQIRLNGEDLKQNPILNPYSKDDIDLNMSGITVMREQIGNVVYNTFNGKNEKYQNLFLNLGKEIKLKENEYFLMGDNRNDSYDSLSFGPVKRESITAKFLSVYFSVNLKDFTCDASVLSEKPIFSLDENPCPSDWISRLQRSKIRLNRIGYKGFEEMTSH